MGDLEGFIDQQLLKGRAFFTKPTALAALQQSPKALQAAAARLARKGRLVAPAGAFIWSSGRRIATSAPRSRPLDQPAHGTSWARLPGLAPEGRSLPWRRPPSRHGLSGGFAAAASAHRDRPASDRVSLPDARGLCANEPARVARSPQDRRGVRQGRRPRTDAARHVPLFSPRGRNQRAAQAVHDLGAKARGSVLAAAAKAYDNTAVRRLGYLLEHFGYTRQSRFLAIYAEQAKSFKLLDPSNKPAARPLATREERNKP